MGFRTWHLKVRSFSNLGFRVQGFWVLEGLEYLSLCAIIVSGSIAVVQLRISTNI